MNDKNNLVFHRFFFRLKKHLGSGNVDDKDQADQKDETKLTGDPDSSSEGFCCTD